MTDLLAQYGETTIFQSLRLIYAADHLARCMAEFPDDPGAWQEPLEDFDQALAQCPGTLAFTARQEIAPPTFQQEVVNLVREAAAADGAPLGGRFREQDTPQPPDE
jgi:hypothetical protein